MLVRAGHLDLDERSPLAVAQAQPGVLRTRHAWFDADSSGAHPQWQRLASEAGRSARSRVDLRPVDQDWSRRVDDAQCRPIRPHIQGALIEHAFDTTW